MINRYRSLVLILQNWNSKRTVLNQFGFPSTVYDLKPIDIDENKFALEGNQLVTTDAHAEARDMKCKRYATTPEQIARVKIAMEFIKPFREVEKHIVDKEIVSTKSYIRQVGLPYPLCITRISEERKELQPNPEFVEGRKVEQPQYDSLASKVLSQGKYAKAK